MIDFEVYDKLIETEISKYYLGFSPMAYLNFDC